MKVLSCEHFIARQHAHRVPSIPSLKLRSSILTPAMWHLWAEDIYKAIRSEDHKIPPIECAQKGKKRQVQSPERSVSLL